MIENEKIPGTNVVKCSISLLTEIPKDMTPTFHTLQILAALERNGSVFFQVDDTPIHQTTVDQLREISNNVGYTFFNSDFSSCVTIVDRNAIEITL